MRVVLRSMPRIPRDKDEKDEGGQDGHARDKEGQHVVSSLLQNFARRARCIRVLRVNRVNAQIKAERIHFGYGVATQRLGEEAGGKFLP